MKYLLFALALVATPALAAVTISLSGLVDLVIHILILAAVVWLLLFIVGKWDPPEPFKKFLPAIIYTVAALIMIGILLNFAGVSLVNFR